MAKISRYTTALYLINVLQPLGFERLLEEINQVIAPEQVSEHGLQAILSVLTARRLIARAEGGNYSCTSLGLYRLSGLGFWKVRDKNRMLILADLMKNG